MRGVRQSAASKIGLPPGTPVYTGDRPEGPARVRMFQYGVDHFEERADVSVEAITEASRNRSYKWIDVDGIHDVALVQRLCEIFHIHPLTIEDVVHVGMRPKAEEYDDYFFVVIEMLNLTENGEGDVFPRFKAEQISVIFGARFVLTFQERPGDVWDPVRKRLRGDSVTQRLRRLGSDYLAYTLLDAIVDHYFLVLDTIGDEVEAIEEIALDNLGEDTVARIHDLKRQLLMLRKTVWPLREVSGVLQRTECAVVAPTTAPYLRDLHDHVVQAIETTELYRESAVALLELYLAGTSNRLNQVMKVLTVLTAVFIPITFVAGIYGMNFDYMPELRWKYGYFFTLGLMATMSLGMLAYFRRQGWI
jgi:magnesium transporter